jgi:hypothetical protein
MMMSETTTETRPQALRCSECQAPLEPTQRYCVVCGARQQDADNPAMRYLSEAARRRRLPAGTKRRTGVAIGVAALLAALPLAAGAGVLVGRSGNSSEHDLLTALRNQKATVIDVAGSATTADSATPPTAADAAEGTSVASPDGAADASAAPSGANAGSGSTQTQTQTQTQPQTQAAGQP